MKGCRVEEDSPQSIKEGGGKKEVSHLWDRD